MTDIDEYIARRDACQGLSAKASEAGRAFFVLRDQANALSREEFEARTALLEVEREAVRESIALARALAAGPADPDAAVGRLAAAEKRCEALKAALGQFSAQVAKPTYAEAMAAARAARGV